MPDRAEMVREQLAARGISDPRVLAAMARVPREAFVASDQRAHAYEDRALSIGHEQTISQPWIVAAICQALALTGSERVLEIGSGSGYSTAVLASLAREVVGYEFVPELAEAAGRRIAEQGIRNVKVHAGDGVSEARGRFEAIAVHARVREVPRELAGLLGSGGRMVAPLVVDEDAEALTLLTLVGEPAATGPVELRADVIAPTRFVPLRGASDAAI